MHGWHILSMGTKIMIKGLIIRMLASPVMNSCESSHLSRRKFLVGVGAAMGAVCVSSGLGVLSPAKASIIPPVTVPETNNDTIVDVRNHRRRGRNRSDERRCRNDRHFRRNNRRYCRNLERNNYRQPPRRDRRSCFYIGPVRICE